MGVVTCRSVDDGPPEDIAGVVDVIGVVSDGRRDVGATSVGIVSDSLAVDSMVAVVIADDFGTGRLAEPGVSDFVARLSVGNVEGDVCPASVVAGLMTGEEPIVPIPTTVSPPLGASRLPGTGSFDIARPRGSPGCR